MYVTSLSYSPLWPALAPISSLRMNRRCAAASWHRSRHRIVSAADWVKVNRHSAWRADQFTPWQYTATAAISQNPFPPLPPPIRVSTDWDSRRHRWLQICRSHPKLVAASPSPRATYLWHFSSPSAAPFSIVGGCVYTELSLERWCAREIEGV